MAGTITFGIKLKFDGKDVEAGVQLTRAQAQALGREFANAGSSAAAGFGRAKREINSFESAIASARNQLAGLFGAYQATQAIRSIGEMASQMQQLDARLKVATSSTREFEAAQAGVFELANRWGSDVIQTAGAFARLNPVIANMGGTASTTLKMLDGLAASLRLSGATAAETSAVLLQFSQAMGSGRVGGDEFRSMMENAEPLMRAVANQMGKTTAELRQMAEEGKLTSSVFGNALLPAIDKLRDKAATIPLGLNQAWQVLQNNLTRSFGEEFSNQSSAAAQAIKALANNTDGLARALHAAEYAAVELGKGIAVVGAGAGAAWMAVQARAAYGTASAFVAMQAARVVDAQAAVAQATAHATETAALLAEAQAQRAMAAQVALYGPQRAAIERQVAVAEAEHAAAATAAATAEARLAEVTAASTIAGRAKALTTTAGTAATTAAAAATAALGGPLGIAIALLTAGAAAWAIWGDKAEDATTRAKKRLDEIQKGIKFGSGEAGALRAEIAALEEANFAAFTTEGSAAEKQYAEGKKLLAAKRALLADLEAAEAQAAAKTTGGAPTERLSAAGEYSKLTEQLKWREKVERDHQDNLVKMQGAYLDKWLAAKSDKERADLERNHKAALAAQLEANRREIQSLPDVQQNKATIEARADVATEWAKSRARRVVDTLTQEREQFRISTDEFVRQSIEAEDAALLAAIEGAKTKRKVAQQPAERIKIDAQINELEAQRNDLIAKGARTREDAAQRQQKDLLALQAAAGKVLDPMEAAAREFDKQWDEVLNRALAEGGDVGQRTLDAYLQAWKRTVQGVDFNTAAGKFDQVVKDAEAKIAKLRADVAEGKISAVDAMIGEKRIRDEAALDLEQINTLLRQMAESIDDPAVKTKMEEITKAFHQARQAAADANFSDFWMGARKGAEDYIASAANVTKNAANFTNRALQSMEDAWVQYATTGKASIRDLAQVFLAETARMFYRQNMAQGAASMVSGIAGFLGNALGFGAAAAPAASMGFGMAGDAGTLLGFADGGDHRGGWRMVGERGPELEATGPARIFNADQTRQILSGSGGSGGGDVKVYQTLHFAVDSPQAAREAVMAMMPQIQAATVAGVIEARRRGGAMRAAFA